MQATDEQKLPPIPLLDVREGGYVALAADNVAITRQILKLGAGTLGPVGGVLAPLALRYGDRVVRRWLDRIDHAYVEEIRQIAELTGLKGVYALNMSYEWACTTGTAPDPGGTGNRMLRTLDWRQDGLGRTVVIARMRGEAGEYYNITWPGFTGMITGFAPGRFAVAINQAPMRRHGRTLLGDWLANRRTVWASDAISPAHLLRKVFETCKSYDDAVRMLSDTPVCIPVLFTISGVEANNGCLIERLETESAVHPCPVSTANHFLAWDFPALPRGYDSPGRHACMMQHLHDPSDNAWLQFPILNQDTRVAVVANAASGNLRVQGFEKHGPVTAAFTL